MGRSYVCLAFGAACYFSFFYDEKFKGFPFKRFTKFKCNIKDKSDEIYKDICEYPWYDSREIIKTYNVHYKGKFPVEYYPGTYLRSMLYMLYAVMIIGLLIFWVSIIGIIANYFPLFLSLTFWTSGSFILFIFAVLLTLYIAHSVIKSYLRCKILESGLLSIQTSGFVWRIVCISHLIAKIESINDNKEKSTQNQIYKGYTKDLASVAHGLGEKLSEPHEWLEKQENKIYKFHDEHKS